MLTMKQVKYYDLLMFICVWLCGDSADAWNICEDQLYNCDCTYYVNCYSKNITLLRDNLVISKGLTKSDFSNNYISDLSSSTFESAPKFFNLLDMSNNLLRILPNGIFAAFPWLETLDLNNNKISHIENQVFQDVKNLTILDLSFNHLESLPDEIFDSLKQLQTLRISYNKLTSLPENAFRNLNSLHVLDLSFLWLKTLPEDLFEGDLIISELDLSHNRFIALPTTTLAKLQQSLKILHFSGNPVRVLKRGAFGGLYKLEKLEMQPLLYLEGVEAYAFQDLVNLRRLVMQYMPKLEDIHPKAFHLQYPENNHTSPTLCPVSDFTLSFSTLSMLPQELLKWDRLRYIALRNNKWNCDCNMAWIKDSVLDVMAAQNMYCLSPKRHRGKSIHSLTQEELTCETAEPNHKRTGRTLIFLTLLGVVCGLLTVMILVRRRRGWVLIRPKRQGTYAPLENPAASFTVYDRTEVLRANLPSHAIKPTNHLRDIESSDPSNPYSRTTISMNNSNSSSYKVHGSPNNSNASPKVIIHDNRPNSSSP